MINSVNHHQHLKPRYHRVLMCIESENVKFAQNSGILDSHSYLDIIQLNVYAL